MALPGNKTWERAVPAPRLDPASATPRGLGDSRGCGRSGCRCGRGCRRGGRRGGLLARPTVAIGMLAHQLLELLGLHPASGAVLRIVVWAVTEDPLAIANGIRLASGLFARLLVLPSAFCFTVRRHGGCTGGGQRPSDDAAHGITPARPAAEPRDQLVKLMGCHSDLPPFVPNALSPASSWYGLPFSMLTAKYAPLPPHY